MSLLKYVDRLKRMDDLIRRRATGSAREFSRKINISESQLFMELKEMKELGAPIDYCHRSRSYYYKTDCRLVLNFDQSASTRGGNGYFEGTNSDHIGDGVFRLHTVNMFD